MNQNHKIKLSPVAKKQPVVARSLEDINLSSKEMIETLVTATTETVVSSIPGISKILEWVERVNQKSREQKLATLLEQYASTFGSIQKALSQLGFLVSTRGGQTLFPKLIQLLDKGSSDQEFISILAKVLKNMSDEEVETNFQQNEYLLSQIDNLSPQALIILSKYGTWGNVSIHGTTTTSGKTMAGDWASQAMKFFVAHTGIKGTHTSIRVEHTFLELESAGIISLVGSNIKCTPVGSELYDFIS